jgi:host factor-I protein
LVNGIKLTGVVSSFDQYTFTLSGGDEDQLIFKSAVATVMPVRQLTGNER